MVTCRHAGSSTGRASICAYRSRCHGGSWWCSNAGRPRSTSATAAEADLNDDGRPDLLLQADDIAYCGSAGCGAWAILATPQGYSSKAITLANFGGWLFVRKEVHHRMHDLRYDDANYIFRWNGRVYR